MKVHCTIYNYKSTLAALQRVRCSDACCLTALAWLGLPSSSHQDSTFSVVDVHRTQPKRPLGTKRPSARTYRPDRSCSMGGSSSRVAPAYPSDATSGTSLGALRPPASSPPPSLPPSAPSSDQPTRPLQSAAQHVAIDAKWQTLRCESSSRPVSSSCIRPISPATRRIYSSARIAPEVFEEALEPVAEPSAGRSPRQSPAAAAVDRGQPHNGASLKGRARRKQRAARKKARVL